MNPALIDLALKLFTIATEANAALAKIRANDPALWAEIQKHAAINTAAFDAARPDGHVGTGNENVPPPVVLK